MTHRPAWQRALCALLLLTACSEEPNEEDGMACTQIGCTDGFVVNFVPNASWPSGSYEFVFELDGERTTCSGNLPLPACGTPALTCVPARENVMISESGCALSADAHGFAGFQVGPPNPTAIGLTISRDGAPLVEQSWTPEYQTSQPNGPGCEPTCVSASAELTVP